MSPIPRSPEEFIETWLPARFERIRESVSGRSSAGSITVHLTDPTQSWSLGIVDGQLVVSRAVAPDTVAQISLSRAAFETILIQSARSVPNGATRDLAVLEHMAMSPERARQMRALPGSLALVVKDGELAHRIVLTPGTRTPDPERPTCTLRLSRSDLAELESGRMVPFQLLMTGRLTIEGDAQVAMMFAAAMA